MSTLAELRSKFRDENKKDPNGKVWSDSQVNNLLNLALLQIQSDGNYKWSENQADYTFSTTSGTQEYALPNDFIRIALVRYNGDNLRRTTRVERKRIQSSFSSAAPIYYYTYGSNLGFDPIPDTAGTIDLEYYKRLPKMTASVDSPFSEDFDEAIVKYAVYKSYIQVADYNRANAELQDYKLELSTLVNSYIFDDEQISFGTQRRGYYPRDNVLCR